MITQGAHVSVIYVPIHVIETYESVVLQRFQATCSLCTLCVYSYIPTILVIAISNNIIDDNYLDNFNQLVFMESFLRYMYMYIYHQSCIRYVTQTPCVVKVIIPSDC